MTTVGERFINSLQDGRTVWLDNEKVENVAAHPAFQGTLNTLRQLFDTLNDPETRDRVGFQSPKTGEYVHNAYLVPTSMDDIKRRTVAFELWDRRTHGVMSRLSEYARSLVTGWYAARERYQVFDRHFAEKITEYYEEARDHHRFVTTALLDPQIDRSKGPSEQKDPDAFLRIVRKTEDGVILRGAKMIATAAPYTHDFLVYPFHRIQQGDLEHAHMMIIPANTPGLHIVCRESFSSEQAEDHPISSRYDEMDAILLFDDAFVPWERVFLHDNPEAVWQLRMDETANSLAYHSTVVRLLVKLEFVAGVAFAIADVIGANHHLHVQEKLGEIVIQIETIRALLHASEAGARPDEFGTWLPDLTPIETARNLGPRYYPRAIEILQQIGAGGFIQVPSKIEQIHGELAGLIRKYYRGAKADAESRIRLFKLAWDLIGSPLGSRHELYERFYLGDPVRTYANQYLNCKKERLEQRLEDFWKRIRQKEDTPGERKPTLSI
ncbi:4-hydroxyphenylacetate 3-hydroxylase [Polycladomyces sp. WAk]|uniref:4-hydroxyphenylacetate 3-hydroxylase n=1 Tax=Polycladomyces zharkentensis TaxID=2807616 RepID=A0ABS2WKG0_9BACL|nr:4-hydroxyphenylacetate 3-hydroxylase N-terminal domain-containing protein [Polycladomyces sp. WAk]MBN2910045.1 4-hydroxyphenylacetate 3-hydroxylase [Polycladomyces sp. WAk]